MIRDFHNRFVLTSLNSEAFLTFRYEPGDDVSIILRPVDSIPERTFYINGIDANLYPSEGYGLQLNEDASIASFHIYTRLLDDFDYTMQVASEFKYESLINWTSYDSSGIGFLYPSNPTLTQDVSSYGVISNSPGNTSFIYSNIFKAESSTLDISIYMMVESYDIFPKFYVYENSIGTQIELDYGANLITYNPVPDSSIYLRFDASGTSGVCTFAAACEVKQVSSTPYDVSISNRQFKVEAGDINIYETTNIQVDDETSYMLLRTNAKFTGNIKLIADSSNNLYLDTFKVSDILNNKKYRKQRVSGESVFSGDVRRTFATLPYGEMYRIDAEDTLNISVPKTEIYKQYNTTYTYGARLFEDELYDDDYSLLAPLWINSTLPDYFAIFRIDGVYNSETYDDADLSELATKYLKEGELIKTWGLKLTTPIGNYLRNHLSELLSVRTPLFLSLSDPTQKDPDPNTWYGIAVDKGIITGRSETPYFFDQKETFTDTNAFLSEGFERLNLLCPNLINMEYVFSDSDVSLYTMHRYFGLYLTENDLFEISYYSQDPDSSTISVLSLDGRDSSSFFSSIIFDQSTGDVIEQFQNRIFTLNDVQKIKRITNVSQINGETKSYVNEWLNKPGEQLFSTEVEEKTTNKFLTINLKNKLNQGEHLRFIDRTNYVIWEIYGIDANLLDAGEAWPYVSFYEDASAWYPTVYRIAFSIKGTITDQINAIKKAFDIFNQEYAISPPFETTIMKEGKLSLSFEIKDSFNSHDIVFQRITAQTVNDLLVEDSDFNNAAGYDDIEFYGVFTPSISDFERVEYDASYGPINFELFGDRNALTINLLNFNENHMYSLDSSLGDKFEDYTMYMSTDKWYRLITKFVITTTSNYYYNYVVDPHELDDNIIISTTDPIYRVNGKWNAYSTYPLVISLMGINPVKDFDFTVYDSSLGFKSDYWYNRNDDLDTYTYKILQDNSLNINIRNSFEIVSGSGEIYINNHIKSYDASTSSPFYFNTFDGSATIVSTGSADTLITYNQIDGSSSFVSYDPSVSEEYLNNYYSDPSTRATLKYGLTVPYVVKWVSTGTDCRNNQLRLMLDASIYDSSSNFIPYNDEFAGELSYPVFKYLDTGTKAWEDYVFFDINDVVEYIEDGSTYRTSFRDLMLNETYTDVFSKLVYSNHNISKTRLRSSICYYNNYKNSVDVIIKGMNLSFFLDENAKNLFNIQDWDRFRVSFISTSSRNKDNNYPIEVFVNENTETILIVWYQGSDVLNYNKRYSTFFGGKNTMYDFAPENEFKAFYTNKYWSFVKPPFIVNNASLSSDLVNIFGMSSGYDSSLCSQFAQLNWNFGDVIYSVFNAYGSNVAISYSFEFFDTQYNTFNQYVDYSYLKNTATYGNGILNYGYLYMNNTNFYKEEVCGLELFQNIISSNNIQYYIFKGDVTYTNSTFSVPPVYLIINKPKLYKGIYTYSGWYRPKFNNVLDFNYNENANIIQTVEKDFTLANTNCMGYSNIPQLWYNKVVSQVTTTDVSTKNAINYISDFNAFKSQWDANYYILDSSTGSKSYVDGFNSSQELPSYFGSKLIKLPDSLTLDDWDLTTASYTKLNGSYDMFEFNLTRKIISMFKLNTTFTGNWAALTTSDNIINNYIQKTIVGYYNISKSKISLEIWTKRYNGSFLSYTFDDEFVLDTAANVDAYLTMSNNENVYTIKVPKRPLKTYFIKFKLFEK